jgi:hypothetical protein
MSLVFFQEPILFVSISTHFNDFYFGEQARTNLKALMLQGDCEKKTQVQIQGWIRIATEKVDSDNGLGRITLLGWGLGWQFLANKCGLIRLLFNTYRKLAMLGSHIIIDIRKRDFKSF